MTLEDLKLIRNKEIFMSGLYTIDGEMSLWVAKKGEIEDWAIYYGDRNKTQISIAEWGDKIKDVETIQKLVNPDKLMLEAYRY